MTITRNFLCENTDGYFVAFLDNDGIRIGLKGMDCFDFPHNHPKFKEITNLTIFDVEDYYDDLYANHHCKIV